MTLHEIMYDFGHHYFVGFGLLEAGSVSSKNEVNIMVKNAVDVIFGGLTYWAFGYGLAFGDKPGTNMFFGVGQWTVDSTPDSMGVIHATFIFQLSFATTATTIVSGNYARPSFGMTLTF